MSAAIWDDQTVCVIATDANWAELQECAKSMDASGMRHYSRLADVPWGAPYSAYFLDIEVPDIDLWPLPILSRQFHGAGRSESARDVSVHVLKLHGEMRLEAIPPLKALNLNTIQSMDRVLDAMVDISAPSSATKLSSVRHVAAGGGVFLVRMKNGTSYLLKLADLDEADSTDVVSSTVSGDGEYFEVKQASGNVFEVPWDDVLYHCEPSYEFFKGRQPVATVVEGRERAERIGKCIRELRVQKGVTVSGLARDIGMQRSNLSRVESGKHVPSLDTLERIAEALDVPVSRLVAR